jgi:hypothetical protein
VRRLRRGAAALRTKAPSYRGRLGDASTDY